MLPAAHSGTRRCLFLDRDGVINAKPPAGQYILRWEDFRLIPEAVSWIRLFKAAGFLAIVITNQRCVALGLLSGEDLQALHDRMCAELAAQGARARERTSPVEGFTSRSRHCLGDFRRR